MRSLLLLAAVAACNGGSDPAEEVVDCSTWPQFTGATKCERACAAGPSNATPGIACMQPDNRVDCTPGNVATYEGQRGCCAPVGTGPVEFTPCEGE